MITSPHIRLALCHPRPRPVVPPRVGSFSISGSMSAATAHLSVGRKPDPLKVNYLDPQERQELGCCKHLDYGSRAASPERGVVPGVPQIADYLLHRASRRRWANKRHAEDIADPFQRAAKVVAFYLQIAFFQNPLLEGDSWIQHDVVS